MLRAILAAVLLATPAAAQDQDAFKQTLIDLGNKSVEDGLTTSGTAINFPAPCTVFVRYTVMRGGDQLIRSWLFDARYLTEITGVDGEPFGIMMKADATTGSPNITMSQQQSHDGKVTRGNRRGYSAAMNFPLSRSDLQEALSALKGYARTCKETP